MSIVILLGFVRTRLNADWIRLCFVVEENNKPLRLCLGENVAAGGIAITYLLAISFILL
jgi:hypothetical protein